MPSRPFPLHSFCCCKTDTGPTICSGSCFSTPLHCTTKPSTQQKCFWKYQDANGKT